MITNQDVRDAIVELRGGIPEKCDFCQQPTPEQDMHPEEAGEWACITCIERWYKEEMKMKSEFDAYRARCLEQLGVRAHDAEEILRWCFLNPVTGVPERKPCEKHSFFSRGEGRFACSHCGVELELR